MHKLCLIVLCGLPGSGKTSLVQLLKSEQNKFTVLAVEYDKLLSPEVEKGLIEDDEKADSSWKTYRAEIVTCVDMVLHKFTNKSPWKHDIDLHASIPGVRDELWEKFKGLIKLEMSHNGDMDEHGDNLCIVIDDNMYYRSMRYAYYQLSRKYTISFCQVYMKVDLDTAFSRNVSRKVKVADDVIATMATKMEVPDPERFSWEKFSAVKDSDSIDMKIIYELIAHSLCEPVQPVQEVDVEQQNQSRFVCSESFIHQSDQILRRIVSEQMKVAYERQLSKLEMKEFATSIQTKKKELLECLRTGALNVPSNIVALTTDSSKHPDSDLFKFLRSKFGT